MYTSIHETERTRKPSDHLKEEAHAVTRQGVVACVDGSRTSHKLISHAIALARALDGRLTLLRVLDVDRGAAVRADPVDWNLLRREVHENVRMVAAERNAQSERVDIRVLEGNPVDLISRWLKRHDVRFTVMGMRSDDNIRGGQALGNTARRLVDAGAGVVLLVPPTVPDQQVVSYKRLLVPLDGSHCAESILPLAVQLARAEQAELVLAHVVPCPALTAAGPLEPGDLRLREHVMRRNERVARDYLDDTLDYVAANGVSVRKLVVRSDDPRDGITRVIADLQPDLVVLSGQGNSNRTDVACGSFASHLVAHATTPTLISFGTRGERRPTVAGHAPEARFPVRSDTRH